jgi:excisionase family DNA binding protein
MKPKRKPEQKVETKIEPRLLRVEEAAKYLGTTIHFMRTLGWDRQIPFLRLGQRILFDRADLDAFVERRKRET